MPGLALGLVKASGRIAAGHGVFAQAIGLVTLGLAAIFLPGDAWAASPVPAVAPPAGLHAGKPVIVGESYTLPSKLLAGSRRINVYLPAHYQDPARRFPVLYLLDGGEREDFIHIGALAQITAAYGQGEEMIVIGIEGVDRQHDLTSPTLAASDLKLVPDAGGADRYRRFLAEELRPWIVEHFKTNGHNAIIGESLAGLFVLETMLKSPASFDDYIAISPSLWWNAGQLTLAAAADLRGSNLAGRRAFIAFDRPAPPAEPAEKELALQARLELGFVQAAPASLEWTIIHSPEGHATIYHPAALQALRKLYAIQP